jgi:hypothetical protein
MNKNSAILFSILLFSLSQQAFSADDCSPIRLDQPQADGTAGSMQYVETRNQGDWGVCFSEVGSELVDAYRFSRLHDPNHDRQSSEMSAVFSLDDLPISNPYSDGGRECDAIEMIRANGYNDRFSEMKCVLKNETPTTIATVKTIYDKYAAIQSTSPNHQLNDASLQAMKAELVSGGIAASNIPSPAVLQELMALDFSGFFWDFEIFSCVQGLKKFSIAMPGCLQMTPHADQDFIQTWNRRLSMKNPLPVSVDFCASVLWDGKAYKGVVANGMSREQCNIDSFGSTDLQHVVLLIGRRKNKDTGACQVLVRNSWGRECKRSQRRIHPPGLTSTIPKPIGVMPDGSPKPDAIFAPEWECDNGDTWVDEDSLAKSSYGISWVDEN